MNFFSFNFPLREYFFVLRLPPPPPISFLTVRPLYRVNSIRKWWTTCPKITSENDQHLFSIRNHLKCIYLGSHHCEDDLNAVNIYLAYSSTLPKYTTTIRDFLGCRIILSEQSRINNLKGSFSRISNFFEPSSNRNSTLWFQSSVARAALGFFELLGKISLPSWPCRYRNWKCRHGEEDFDPISSC